MKIIITVLLFIFISCSNNNELGPVDIHYGQDICERCKMIISEEIFSSQIIHHDGTVNNFDDIGGMLVYIMDNQINTENKKIYVKDYQSKKWINSKEAIFLSLEDINTPMNFGLVAVSNKQAALDLISNHPGIITGSYVETLNHLRNEK